MKLLIYGISFLTTIISTDITSESNIYGVICPILAVVFFFLFVAQLLNFLGLSRSGSSNNDGGFSGGGFGGGDGGGCSGGDGGGC